MRPLPDRDDQGWKRALKRGLLDLDARVDSGVFQARGFIRERYERFSTFMDRFHVSGVVRILNEAVSEGLTLGTVGLILMLALAIPAFRETADDDWLKKSELAVTFLDRYGNEVGSRGVKQNDSLKLEDFPDHLIKAVLATEDRRFYEHFGIDIAGTLRALGANARAGGVVQGGSSLSQQLAKNLFLSNERTIERKVKEAFLAMWLESRLSKNQILKLYLDRAYMGGGAFGVDAAAQFYFGKSARDVNLSEAAMLAGLFKAPTKFAPHINLPAARARANVVLDNLVEAGFMTEGQVFGARRNPAVAVDRRDERSPNYYLDWAFDEVKKIVDALPKSVSERAFVVRTALDVNLQRNTERVVENMLSQYGQEYGAKQAATVLMDIDGSVRAMVGGRDYGASQFNRAVDSLRQPGSSFKPYVYATALMNGFKPTSVVVDCTGVHRHLVPAQLFQRLFRLDDADAGDHPFRQRHSDQAVDRDRPRQPEGRPRQDHRDGPQGGAALAAYGFPVAADRRRGGDGPRPHRRLFDLPQPRQGGGAARHPRIAFRCRRVDLALRPRRQEAGAGPDAAGRDGHEPDDEQGRGGGHRQARDP